MWQAAQLANDVFAGGMLPCSLANHAVRVSRALGSDGALRSRVAARLASKPSSAARVFASTLASVPKCLSSVEVMVAQPFFVISSGG